MFLADPGEARGCSTYTSVTHKLINSFSDPTTLRRRHAQMVRDSSSRYNIDYVIVIYNFLNPKRHQNHITGSKVMAILVGRFCLLVELHWEGSASAACAAGLFLKPFPYNMTTGHSCPLVKTSVS